MPPESERYFAELAERTTRIEGSLDSVRSSVQSSLETVRSDVQKVMQELVGMRGDNGIKGRLVNLEGRVDEIETRNISRDAVSATRELVAKPWKAMVFQILTQVITVVVTILVTLALTGVLSNG